MPIPVQTIVNRMAADLDAEASDRYTFAQDYKYAINTAIEWVCSIFNKAFAENKLSPENLRELVKISIWQANQFNRISYNPADTGSPLWTILSVHPEVKVYPEKVIVPLIDPTKSIFRGDLAFLSSEKYASRSTLEEWSIYDKNIFVSGNSIMQGALKTYAYLDFADYSAASYSNSVNAEIEISPSVAQKLVGIGYLKYPTQINLITDIVQFPESMTQIITDKALNVIAIKQGDNTTLNSATAQDVAQLVMAMR